MLEEYNSEDRPPSYQIGRMGDSWTGSDLVDWLKLEDQIRPAITKLLPYDTSPLMPNYDGLETFGELMFLYTNKDLWGF